MLDEVRSDFFLSGLYLLEILFSLHCGVEVAHEVDKFRERTKVQTVDEKNTENSTVATAFGFSFVGCLVCIGRESSSSKGFIHSAPFRLFLHIVEFRWNITQMKKEERFRVAWKSLQIASWIF